MRGEFGVDDVVRDHRERRQEESQLKHLELGEILNYWITKKKLHYFFWHNKLGITLCATVLSFGVAYF